LTLLLQLHTLVNDQSKSQEPGMATISAFDAKTRFGELLERVSRGEEIVITRHDKPVARIVPEGAQRLDDVRRAVAGLRELQRRMTQRRRTARLSDHEVRAAIEHGRQ
jgi:prevent-host-death family protein